METKKCTQFNIEKQIGNFYIKYTEGKFVKVIEVRNVTTRIKVI